MVIRARIPGGRSLGPLGRRGSWTQRGSREEFREEPEEWEPRRVRGSPEGMLGLEDAPSHPAPAPPPPLSAPQQHLLILLVFTQHLPGPGLVRCSGTTLASVHKHMTV